MMDESIKTNDIPAKWTKDYGRTLLERIEKLEQVVKAHQKQFDNFITNTLLPEHLRGKKRKRRLNGPRPPPAPRPPHSPVQLYVASKISKIETKDENTRKLLRRDYSLLSDKKKFRWIRKAKEDQERYETEIAEYKIAYPDVALKRVKPTISDKENLKYENRVFGRPIPPARSSYLVFCGETMSALDSNDNVDPKNKLRDAVSQWRDLKPEKKKEYDRRHLESVCNYIEAMKNYMANASPEDRLRIETREEKTTPEYWSKILKRLKLAESKSSIKVE